MLISPMALLIVAVVIMLAAGVLGRMLARRRRRLLQALARRWQMHYSRTDRFRLGARVASRLAVPGVAAVGVCDVIYGLRDDCYRYIFTLHYTTGTTGRRQSQLRAAALCEPRRREVAEPAGGPAGEQKAVQGRQGGQAGVRVSWAADPRRPLAEQYEELAGALEPRVGLVEEQR